MDSVRDCMVGDNARRPENTIEILLNVIKLLEHEISSPFMDRIVTQMDGFLAIRSPTSFPILDCHEVPVLTKLVIMLFDRYDSEPIYRKYFFKFLEHLTLTVVLKNTTDLFPYLSYMKDYFDMFGHFLVNTEHNEIIASICNIVEDTLTNMKKTRSYMQTAHLLEAALLSNFPVSISKLLLIFVDEFYMSLLKAVEALVKSENICKLFITLNMIDILLVRLYDDWNSDERVDIVSVGRPVVKHLNITMKIVWRLAVVYNHGSELFKRSCSEIMIHAPAWRSCRSVLISLVTTPGHRKLRNKFAWFVMTIPVIVPWELYRPMEIDIILLSFASELTTEGTWASQVRFTRDPLDFELKLLMLTNMHYYRKGSVGKEDLQWQTIILGLMRILTFDEKLIWTPVQRAILVKHALIGIECLLHEFIDDFIENKGPAILLRLLELMAQEKLDLKLLPFCLRCINTSINLRCDVRNVYITKGIMDTLLVTAKLFLNAMVFTTAIQSTISTLFCVLEKLQAYHRCMSSELVTISIKYMKRFLTPMTNDMCVDPHLLIAALDLMKETVIANENTIEMFLETGGIYLLLDMIEKFPTAIKMICLTTLIDLCQVSTCIPYVLTWRSEKGEAVLQVLMRLFRQQSLLYGVDFTEKCVLGDLENPLMNTKMRHFVRANLLRTGCCAGALEMLGKCELKIYALLHLLACDYKTDSDLVNNCYQISKDSLSVIDKITILVAENFLALKMGEIWSEFSKNLEVDGIRPIVFDQDVINDRIQQYHQLTLRIRESQELYLEQEERKEGVKEMLLYKNLRDQTLSESLEVLNEMNYQARCVETMFRIPAKLKMRNQLTNYELLNIAKPVPAGYHRTVPYTSGITSVFNQRVSVRSNVVITLNEEKPPIPVSKVDVHGSVRYHIRMRV